MKKNTVKINIHSQNLTIVSEESPEYIDKIASDVRNKIDDLLKANRFTPTISAILLCAMQYCDDNFKLNQEIMSLRKENQLLIQRIKGTQADKISSENKKNNTVIYKSPKNNDHIVKMEQQSLFDKENQKNEKAIDKNNVNIKQKAVNTKSNIKK